MCPTPYVYSHQRKRRNKRLQISVTFQTVSHFSESVEGIGAHFPTHAASIFLVQLLAFSIFSALSISSFKSLWQIFFCVKTVTPVRVRGIEVECEGWEVGDVVSCTINLQDLFFHERLLCIQKQLLLGKHLVLLIMTARSG